MVERAFACISVATQEITANEAYRDGMPKLLDIYHVPHWDQADPENSTRKTIEALDALWAKEGDNFCAMTMELVQGEGGFIYGPREFYVEIFEWARRKDIYIWIDEVQTFCRTRELFAYQMFELDKYADIVTIAKALQGAGVIFTEELNPKPGLIAGTFNGAIPSIKAGKKVLDYLTQGGFYGEGGKNHEIEKKFLTKLQSLASGACKGKLGYSGGIGTMISFEIGDSSKEITLEFIKKLFDNGIISFIAGKNPTRVRFLLPVCLTDEHIDDIFNIIEKTVHEVVK